MRPRDTTVSSLLGALRAAEAEVEAPPHVEAAVLAAWDAEHLRPVVSGFSRTSHVWQRAGAIAAAATLASTLTLLGGKLRTAVSVVPSGATTMVLVGEPILAGEPVRVVRMRVPISSLSALGVRSMTGDLVEAVDVDIIVGDDGVARAIRVGM